MYKENQVSKERYDIVISRYKKFIDNSSDINKEPVRVFDPLTPKQMQDLMLIREVSQKLQTKKEDDIRKAEANEEERIVAEEKKEAKEEVVVQEEHKKKE